jgi:YD repeat-containing protein
MVSKVENYILQTPLNIEFKIIEQVFQYNETSRLLSKKIHMPNTELALENTYTYNNLGNLISVTDKNLKTQELRVKYFNFDSNGLNIISSVNEMGHKRSFVFDLQDNLLMSNESNGLITNYVYNPRGNKIYESKAGATNISFVFAWDASAPNSIYSITSQTESGIRKKTIYDSLNRVIRTVSYGFNSEQIYEDTIYNSNGQIRQKSMPYKAYVSESYLVTFEYDELLREIKRTEPGKTKNQSNYFTTQYIGLNVLKQDTLGNSRVEKKNILGQIVSVQDTLGTAAFYSYDPLNNLVKIVDPHGATTVLRYNINNRLVYKDDPYLGVNEHTYNAFSELQSTKYATGQSVFYFRDALGRLIKRSEPEGDTVWVFDTALNGIGKLHKINSNSVNKEFAYDSFGREIESKSFIRSDNYSIRTQYDGNGRINAKIYPSNVTVYNCYNTNGYLMAVSLNDQSCLSYLWKIGDYDAMNNILREEDQNGIKTTYGYNNNGQVTGIRTENLNNVYRNLEYEYDLKKNLIKRTDYDFRGKILNLSKNILFIFIK